MKPFKNPIRNIFVKNVYYNLIRLLNIWCRKEKSNVRNSLDSFRHFRSKETRNVNFPCQCQQPIRSHRNVQSSLSHKVAKYSPRLGRGRQRCVAWREIAGGAGGPRSPPTAERSYPLNRGGLPVGAASADSSTTSRTCSTTKRAGAPVADASPHDRNVPLSRPSVDAFVLSFPLCFTRVPILPPSLHRPPYPCRAFATTSSFLFFPSSWRRRCARDSLRAWTRESL